MLWHIGNLTSLGRNINNRGGNKDFNYKVEHAYRKSKLVINKKIVNEFQDWTPDLVKKRAVSLTSDVLAIWNFDNPSRV